MAFFVIIRLVMHVFSVLPFLWLIKIPEARKLYVTGNLLHSASYQANLPNFLFSLWWKVHFVSFSCSSSSVSLKVLQLNEWMNSTEWIPTSSSSSNFVITELVKSTWWNTKCKTSTVTSWQYEHRCRNISQWNCRLFFLLYAETHHGSTVLNSVCVRTDSGHSTAQTTKYNFYWFHRLRLLHGLLICFFITLLFWH